MFLTLLTKQFQNIPNSIWDLFDQHTQAYITFVFVIIKTLHYIRIGSTHQYPNQSQASAQGATYYAQPQPSSSYNYHKHGNHGHEYHGYYNVHNASHSSIVGGRTDDVFSDHNPIVVVLYDAN